MNSTKISAGIVTYNSKKHLKSCLTSLAKQKHPLSQIIIFDNNSPDFKYDEFKNIVDSIPELPVTEIISSPQNIGFGSAHNKILSKIDGNFYLMLNPDVVLEEDFLLEAINSFTKNPEISALNAQILYSQYEKPTIYSTGHTLFKERRFEDIGIGTPASEHQKSRMVLGFNGACPVIKTKALKDVSYPEGPFDKAYFLYGEDDDLNWRMALAGHLTIYEPKCLAHHIAGASGAHKNPIARRSALYNRWLTIVKNDKLLFFCLDLPFIIGGELFYILIRTIKKPSFLPDYFISIVKFFTLLPHALKRRRITPIRLNRATERQLFEKNYFTRFTTVFKRSFLKSKHKSIWNH